MSGPNQVGVVVGGSLTKSLEVRLDPGAPAALGHYVMAPLDGGAQLLGMVTDIVLRSAEAGSVSWPHPRAMIQPARYCARSCRTPECTPPWR